jgi:tetratricopeptide (TPR) repeat protein
MSALYPFRKAGLLPLAAAALSLAVLSGCAEERNGSFPAGPSPSEEEIRTYLRAKEAYRTSGYSAARRILVPLSRRNPRFYQARILLAKCHYMGGTYEPAREELEALLRTCPGHPQAELWLARSLHQMGETESAEKRLERLLARDPGDHRLLYLAGRLREAADDLPGALDWYHRAALAGEEAVKPLLALGRIYYRFGELKKAEEHLRRAAALVGPESAIDQPLAQLRARIEELSSEEEER